jgi:hypothetical protein
MIAAFLSLFFSPVQRIPRFVTRNYQVKTAAEFNRAMDEAEAGDSVVISA